MTITPFNLLVLMYVSTSMLTHFSLVPDNMEFSSRRIGPIVALRELSILLLFVYLVFNAMIRALADKTAETTNFFKLIVLMIVYLFLTVLLSAPTMSNQDFLVAVRVFILVTVGLLIPIEMSMSAYRIQFVVKVTIFFVLLQVPIVLLQLAAMPPFYGRTFLGPRVVGTLPSALHISIFVGAAALIFVTTRPRHWMKLVGICVFLALASGGRAGMIMILIACVIPIAMRIRRDPLNFYLLGVLAGVLLVGGYFAASAQALSGRVGTTGGVASEARWETWAFLIARNFVGAGWSDWLLGLQSGMGSNTAASVAQGPRNISDSTPIFVLQSYGILGLILLSVFFIFGWARHAGVHPGALLAWFVASNTQILFELHPQNLLILSAIPLAQYTATWGRGPPSRRLHASAG